MSLVDKLQRKQSLALLRNLNWTDAKMGIAVDGNPCPQCRQQLNLYSDDVYGIRWSKCWHCQWFGDSLALLSAWMGMPISAAARSLHGQGHIPCKDFESVWQGYEIDRSRRDRSWELWKRCQSGTAGADQAQIFKLLKSLHIKCQPGSCHWNDEFANRLGWADGRWLREFTFPVAAVDRTPDGPYLISPIERLPGMIIGLLAFNADGMYRLEARTAVAVRGSKRSVRGWIGLSSSASIERCFSGDSMDYLRAWLQSAGSVMPVSCSELTPECWQSLRTAADAPVLCLDRPALRDIRVARALRRPLSELNSSGKEKATRSWLDWLDKMGKDNPDILTELPINSADLQQARQCNYKYVLSAISNTDRSVRTVIGNVCEKSTGWYSYNRQISNARLIVDQIIRGSSDKARYVGRLLIDDKSLSFSISGTVKQVATRLVNQRFADIGWVMSASCRKNLIEIATTLRIPQITDTEIRGGWHADRGEFLFNGVAVGADGRFRLGPVTAKMPAVPDIETEQIESIVGEMMRLDGVVEVLTAVAAVAMSPMLRQSEYGIALRLPKRNAKLSSNRIYWMAKSMGCIGFKPSGSNAARVWRRVERRRGMPLVVRPSFNIGQYSAMRNHWLKINSSRFCIAAVLDDEIGMLAEGRWVVIDAPRLDLIVDTTAASCLLPMFMSWLGRERKMTLCDGNDYLDRMKNTVKAWRKHLDRYVL
jgi:hypothetical protein